MKTFWLTAIFFVLTVMNLVAATASAEPGSALCQPPRHANLAMDQRDDYRSTCLKKKKAQFSVTQCLSVTKAMEYSNNAEESRMTCLYDLAKPPTLKECAAIAKSMEYADSGDEVRWECIRRFNKTLSEKQCLTFAKAMSYPANGERAVQYCQQELR